MLQINEIAVDGGDKYFLGFIFRIFIRSHVKAQQFERQFVVPLNFLGLGVQLIEGAIVGEHLSMANGVQ